jgi:hypothetical protein
MLWESANPFAFQCRIGMNGVRRRDAERSQRKAQTNGGVNRPLARFVTLVAVCERQARD